MKPRSKVKGDWWVTPFLIGISCIVPVGLVVYGYVLLHFLIKFW